MSKAGAVAKLEAHLVRRGFDDGQVDVSGRYGRDETDEDSVLRRARKRLFDASGIPYTIRPCNAGGWPGLIFNGPRWACRPRNWGSATAAEPPRPPNGS